MKTIKGSCLCGCVEFELEDRLRYAGYCHCADCRKFSGSAFSAFGGAEETSFRLLNGEDQLGSYQDDDDTLLCFCRNCGSSLFSRKRTTRMVHVRLGALDDAPGLRPQFHVFYASRAPWHEGAENLVKFDAMPPRAGAA